MVNIAKKQRPWFRICLVAIVAIGLCCVGAYYGRKAIAHWLSERAAKEARTYFDKKDFRNASLKIQHGLRIDKDSAACWEVVADMAENFGRSDAVFARARVVDLRAASLDSVLVCAETALRFGSPAVADDVLGRVGEDHRNDARYQALCGRTATALGKPALAVQHFAQALVLEPKSDQRQLDCAAALLERGWLEDRSSSRATLDRLKAKPEFHAAALRALLKDSLASGESADSVKLVRDLAADPSATLNDKLTLIELLRTTGGGDEASTLLESLKKSARGNSSQVAELTLWMSRTRQFRQALEWSNEFSAEEWSDPRVSVALAASELSTGDWPKLESFTKHGNWGTFEYLRLSLYSRALREQGKTLDARLQWSAAVKAGAAAHTMAELTKLAGEWGWNVEVEELLREMLKDPKDGPWAAHTLYPKLAAKKDTVGLWQVSARLFELDPQNDAVANNVAMYSFLLDKDVTRALQIAQKLYPKHPGEAKYLSTYAYSLYLRGQPEEAVRVMNSLDASALDAPDIAMYFGVFLAAAGDTERAPKYLDLAKDASLLPEEEQLVRRARVRLLELATAKPEQPAKR